MSQPRYGSSSTVGENLATGAVASGGLSLVGAGLWAKGQNNRNAGARLAAANAGAKVEREASRAFLRSAHTKRQEAAYNDRVAARRENLAARTRARLTPLKQPGIDVVNARTGRNYKELYIENRQYKMPGSNQIRGNAGGLYPPDRLPLMDAAVKTGRKKAENWRASASQSEADAKTSKRRASVMDAKVKRGTDQAARGLRLVRAGRPLALVGGLGAIGFAAGAEATRSRPARIRTQKPKNRVGNVVDLGRYRAMASKPDQRGSALVDSNGYRKPLSPSASADWLRANGGGK